MTLTEKQIKVFCIYADTEDAKTAHMTKWPEWWAMSPGLGIPDAEKGETEDVRKRLRQATKEWSDLCLRMPNSELTAAIKEIVTAHRAI